MERRFEEAWRRAMEGAEVEPSGETWQAMESALIAEENKRMKRKVVFYQRLAAASVLFALLLGAYGFYSWRVNSPGKEDVATLGHVTPHLRQGSGEQAGPYPHQRGADQPTDLSDEAASAKPEALAQAGGKGKAPVNQDKDKENAGNTGRTVDISNVLPRTNAKNAFADNTTQTPHAINPVSVDSITVEKSLSLATTKTSGSNTPESEANKQSLQQRTTAKAAESPIKIQKKKEEEPILPNVLASDEKEEKRNGPERFKEDLWASLSVAAGNYNSGALAPGSSVAASPPASYSTTSMAFLRSNVSRSPVGSSRSVGLTIGKHITRRWVILSGINYLNQTSGYTSNSSSLGQAYLANYSSLKQASSVTFTNTYPINSVLEFVAVPVQAGYLIVDRKLGFQMNAGVSADFLLRNTLQDPSGQVSSFSQGAGADSPYRSVNWVGLISTELSYRMSRQYRISIVPGIRYFFDPVFKSGSADHPYVTDIGFRFRYILR